MSTLLVAPDLGLPAATDEVRAISLALQPVVLSGIVRRHDVIDALRGRDWDIIWFVSHGDEHGIALSDGALSISDLTGVVRAAGATAVILNTCSSRLIGLELHYELGVSVVCTVSAIDDVSAYQTGALLAQKLAEYGDLAQAYNASKPGQAQNYLLFQRENPDEEADEVRTILMLHEWGARLSAKIDALDRRMDSELAALRRDMQELSAVVARSVRLPAWHRTAFVLAFFLLFAPTPLYFDGLAVLVGIDWRAGLAFTATSYALSSILWLYLWFGGLTR